ncbi:hypothetical protein FCM35_KLT07201 [Carex littledalei]|uniref:Uncharacterized protein n=1 Tax=Carex littledalei TaxID=544730 RepID=A0A833QYA4_9POAL|nr:hypothetical protein FCM35_KLT07201 [Carex littledalei]
MAVALFHPLLPLLMLSFLLSPAAATTTQHQAPTPEPWPEQFHAVLFMNSSNDLSLADLWYDWPGGRNLHIIKDQLGGPRLFDLEWNNGTSFFYHKEEPLSCRSVQLDVGLLTPNWLDGATYLGRARVDSFLCDAWTKADFIWYYQDVDTKRPVKWVFYTGRTVHVMTYEVGAVLEDSAWQTPAYCFQKNNTTTVQQLEPRNVSLSQWS